MARLNWNRANSSARMRQQGTEEANPTDSPPIQWARRKPINQHEVRTWFITCGGCGHSGSAETTLARLRDAVRAGRVHCSKCGVVVQPRDL